MGTTVCRAVAADPDLTLVAAVDPRLAGSAVGQAAGLEGASLEDANLEFEDGADGLARAGAQVAVDFTEATSAMENLRWCAAHGVHAVVGTTGLSSDDMAELSQLFESADRRANCVMAANFAIGAVLMMRLAEMAAPYMDSAEIVELHHDAKLDAPSGTALHTAERMAGARHAAGAGDWAPDPTRTEVLSGARGGLGPAGARLHSVRLRGLVAHHEVLLGAAGQSLTIRHDSYDRSSFMPGVLLAVKAVASRPGLTIGLEPLLGLGPIS